jgi:hypothetical protein
VTDSEDFSKSADDREVDAEDEFDTSDFETAEDEYDFEDEDEDEESAAARKRSAGH